MDTRARKILIIFLNLLTAACAQQNKYESIMPAVNETCGGTAMKEKYIVHLKNGKWEYIANSNRENFKDTYVKPKIDEIDFIEYDQKINMNANPQPPHIPPGINNWGAQAINADLAWSKGFRGQGITIAVIDTGVDVKHPQLKDQILVNPGESGEKQFNGIDDDGNGYVDDYYGFSFYDQSGDVTDSVGHGTHVAGIIAAQHEDSIIRTGYVQGIAPQAKILPIKFLGESGGTLSASLQGIDYAILRGAKVINASWGGDGCAKSLQQKILEVSSQNILMVVAAGNNGANLDTFPEYPAAFTTPLQITVGALSEYLNLAYYSNYSKQLVHIFAPGSNIVSTVPDDNYSSISGTSMAAPFVTGAVALYLAAHPNWTPSEVRRSILTAGVVVDKLYSNLSQGRLDLSALALEQ